MRQAEFPCALVSGHQSNPLATEYQTNHLSPLLCTCTSASLKSRITVQLRRLLFPLLVHGLCDSSLRTTVSHLNLS